MVRSRFVQCRVVDTKASAELLQLAFVPAAPVPFIDGINATGHNERQRDNLEEPRRVHDPRSQRLSSVRKSQTGQGHGDQSAGRAINPSGLAQCEARLVVDLIGTQCFLRPSHSATGV